MDTKKIEAFLKTIELGSMNKAAEELNYSQSGLFYMIKSLEQELGNQLLVRTPRGVSMTKAGEQLRPLMESALAEEDELLKKAAVISQKRQNSLRIAVLPVFARFYMPEAINRYMEENRETEIDLHVGAEEDLIRWLSEDAVDMAVGEPADREDLIWEKLIEDEIYVAIPSGIDIGEGKTRTVDALLDYPVLFSGNSPFNASIDEFMTGKLASLGRLRVTSLDSSVLLSMMKNQSGMMFLSHWYQSCCPEFVHMYPLDPPVTRKIGIIVKKERKLTGQGRGFADYLRQVCQEIP